MSVPAVTRRLHHESRWNRFDDRPAAERFFLPYPRRWSDWSDAQALGLSVPDFWMSGLAMIASAVALVLLRSVFERCVLCVRD